MLKLNMNRVPIYATIGAAVVSGLVLMPFLVKPALADDVCYPETVNGSGSTGSTPPIYQLNSDCTLHIGPGLLPKIDKYKYGDDAYPIKQHDKVKHIVFDDPTNTRLNKDSSYLFDSYPNVESIEHFNEINTSDIKKTSNMFRGLSHLREPVNLSNLDMNSVTDTQEMFESTNLDMFNGIGHFAFDFNNAQYLNFSGMFENATSTEGIDLSEWSILNAPDLESGLSFNAMFDSAKTPKIDVSSLSNLHITTAPGMFANTNTDIEGLDKFSTQNLIDTTRMFENAKPTNQVDLSSWNTEKIEFTIEMFKGSDIDKFSGMDHWNLQALFMARGMYANLNPSHKIRIQSQMSNLSGADLMFYGSNLNMFPDIANMQLPYASDVQDIFENAKADYLSMADWKNGSNTSIAGMLASPYIKFATFGNKTIGNDYAADFSLMYSRYLFSTNQNVWDRPDLPKEYAVKKWATLPIKPDCDAQFNGNPDDLPTNCWDESQSWVSDKIGVEADEELLDNTTKHYQRIFFRVPSVPVSFNSNGVKNATNMPDMKYFLKVFTSKDDLLPNNVPEDPSGARVFTSWNTQADGKGKTYQPGDHAGHDIQSLDLYAQWKNKAPNVQFNNNGGEGPTPETKPSLDDNTKITVDCTNEPSRNGATFIGWSKTKNEVLEGHDAGDKGKIDVCGYSDKKTVKGLAGRTIDLYATWAKNPKAVFNENRPKDMTALLPATKTITGNWVIDDSTPKTYVAPNIERWNKGYTPDGIYRFDGWMNEDGSPFTGAYLERNDMTINAKWSKIAPADNHNNGNDQNTHDNDTTDDNNGDTADNANNNHGNNGSDNNSNSGSDTTNNQQDSTNRPETTPIINGDNNQVPNSGSLLGPSPEGTSNASREPSTGSGSGYGADSDTGSPSSQPADTDSNDSLAKTGASIIAPIVLIIVSIVGATAAIAFSRMRNRRQQ